VLLLQSASHCAVVHPEALLYYDVKRDIAWMLRLTIQWNQQIIWFLSNASIWHSVVQLFIFPFELVVSYMFRILQNHLPGYYVWNTGKNTLFIWVFISVKVFVTHLNYLAIVFILKYWCRLFRSAGDKAAGTCSWTFTPIWC
jgi:hypothetical protein